MLTKKEHIKLMKRKTKMEKCLLAALYVAEAQLADHRDRNEPYLDYWNKGNTGYETMQIVNTAITKVESKQ